MTLISETIYARYLPSFLPLSSSSFHLIVFDFADCRLTVKEATAQQPMKEKREKNFEVLVQQFSKNE